MVGSFASGQQPIDIVTGKCDGTLSKICVFISIKPKTLFGIGYNLTTFYKVLYNHCSYLHTNKIFDNWDSSSFMITLFFLFLPVANMGEVCV